MKAVCVVAHPDDCVLFAYQFIMDHKDWDWKICYLTYERSHPRSTEVAKFWQRRGISTMFAGLPDVWEYVEKDELGFDTEPAEKWIRAMCDDVDIILTHNHLGEYGHPHHKFINKVMGFIHAPKVYFGTYPEYYNQLTSTVKPPYDIDELPLHLDVIRNVDITSWKYFITPEAQSMV